MSEQTGWAGSSAGDYEPSRDLGEPVDPAPNPGIAETRPPADPVPPEEDAAARARRRRKSIIEWVAILAAAVIAAVVLRTFIVQPYFIPSGSMEPTLLVNDKVLVNKLAYDFHSIHRGDVVVFKKPPKDYSPGIKDLIKRVIGLPNETISGVDGAVYINGRRLAEPWLPRGTITAPFPAVRIPPGDYFMMGDNRGNSADSRVIGPVPGNLVVGRAFLIVWPISQIGTL